ncbi:hypothetical protein BKA93DRAFT_589727 [Sparassis latifolia]
MEHHFYVDLRRTYTPRTAHHSMSNMSGLTPHGIAPALLLLRTPNPPRIMFFLCKSSILTRGRQTTFNRSGLSIGGCIFGLPHSNVIRARLHRGVPRRPNAFQIAIALTAGTADCRLHLSCSMRKVVDGLPSASANSIQATTKLANSPTRALHGNLE